ncbi:uncharacterized protein METZ01_LOCUS342324 [marine metagenome]|uniref:Uncharacterized protein n=1 Tax=marine metagenome TaxID=408172 RepID=A0A382QX43_9ZZZZ
METTETQISTTKVEKLTNPVNYTEKNLNMLKIVSSFMETATAV